MGAGNFALKAAGRTEVAVSDALTWAASAYPGGSDNLVELDGSIDDSAHFGPTTPAQGAGAFSAAVAGKK